VNVRNVLRILCLALLVAPFSAGAATESVALVTGSNRGIGLALVQELAANGWKVIATCRDPSDADDLRKVSAQYPKVIVERLDVADNAAIDALATKYRGLPIDLLVNNAGIVGTYELETLKNFDAKTFEQVLRVNAYAPMRIASVFLPNVEASRQKKIVAITSLLGSIGLVQQSGDQARKSNAPPPARATDTYFYRMSKAALNMGMRVMQNELRTKGVSVGILSPGIVATDARTGRDNGPPPPNLLTPAQSAKALMKLIGELNPQNAGRYLEYTNEELPW
jgi:NAD(P)-dependent dehydrogenase (short-subunit alcohol dehydrogenase family)